MTDRIGQQLGNYRLTRLLGQGGFADVYLAEHIHLGTPAAIKVLSMHLTSDNVEHFRTEARTIARLIHPHIVRVLDFGVEDGTPYLVMDYAPNGSLRQRHPKGSLLPLATIVDYVKQAAEALQYAHEKKLIHRDIKPENLLVGENRQVLLSDFGIALVAQSTRYQNTQEIVGTAAYMAPEQLQGKPRRASDQYALGIIVYEWLSGERPFHGTFTELYSQQMFVPPPPLHEKVPTISSDIEKVVLTALAKEPQQRFTSVKAFATALEQASESTEFPTLAPPHRPLESIAASIPPTQHIWPTIPAVSSNQPLEPIFISTPSVKGERTKPGISRRTVLTGLGGLAVVGIAGGGLLWLEHGHSQPGRNGLVSTPTPASTSAPKITSVSPMTPAQYQTIIITGGGFGTYPPLTNTTSNYLNLLDITGQWRAGYRGDFVGVTVSAWTDNRIEINGFSNYGGGWTFRSGDQVVIAVWNPQTHAGPALFTTIVATTLASTPTPASTPAPKITSVSSITLAQYQTIIITGSGFGTYPPFTNGTSKYLTLQDINGQWGAGYQGDFFGVTVSSWTDNQIEITGFSNFGGNTTFQPGDQVIIAVWNPQTDAGPALFTTIVAD